VVESGAAGAVAVESAGPGEVDCCFEQAARASALRHSTRRLRFIRSPHCMSSVKAAAAPLQCRVELNVQSQAAFHCRMERGGAQLRPRQESLLLGGGALFLLGRVFRTGLAERALINLAATAPAITFTHENRLQNETNEGREVYRAAGPSAKRATNCTCVSVAIGAIPR